MLHKLSNEILVVIIKYSEFGDIIKLSQCHKDIANCIIENEDYLFDDKVLFKIEPMLVYNAEKIDAIREKYNYTKFYIIKSAYEIKREIIKEHRDSFQYEMQILIEQPLVFSISYNMLKVQGSSWGFC